MQMISRARRLVAVSGVAIGLIAFGVGSAHADAQAPSLGGDWISPVLAPGTAGQTVAFGIYGNASSATTFTGVTVQFDVSGLAGMATLVPTTGTCTTVGTVITCAEANFKAKLIPASDQSTAFYQGSESIPLALAPAAGAVAGASGNVAVTVTGAGGVTPGSSTISVSLVDGPGLVITGNTGATASVKPGASYNRALTFTNLGNQAAQGVTLEVSTMGYGVDIPELRKNCHYAAPYEAYCYIPTLVAPGATETLSPVLSFLTTTDLMWQSVQISVVPGYASLSDYTVGTGKPFTLVDSTGATQIPVTGQTSQVNIFGFFESDLTLKVAAATADLAAQASLSPWQGNDAYFVNANITNLGAGYINLSESATYELTGDFALPSGVVTTSVPSSWTPVVGGALDYNATGQAGYSEYQFNGGIGLTANGQAGTATDSGLLIIQAQPGFTGGNGVLTVGVNQASATAVASLFGNIDSDTSNDTTTIAIPAYS